MKENIFAAEGENDYIFVKKLTARCRIGVPPEEKEKPQVIKLSFKIPVDSRRVSESDDIEQTVDYDRVGSWLVDRAEESSVRLLESLAHSLATEAKDKFKLPAIKLTVEKPEVYSGETCSGITVCR